RGLHISNFPENGVVITGAAQNNIIGESNVISCNGGNGIYIEGTGTTSNTISSNSIHCNSISGICLDNGGNNLLPAPIINDVLSFSVLGTACPDCTVEVFSDEADQGKVYEGNTIASSSGAWTWTGNLNGRRLIRRLTVGGIAVFAALACWILFNAYFERQATPTFAEELAAEADELRIEILQDYAKSSRTWWALLFSDQKLDRLQLAVLLAVEAMKRAKTERTEQTLRDALALLPWSNHQQAIDTGNSSSIIDFSHDGVFLAAGGGRDDTLIWDLSAEEITARVPHGGTGGPKNWQDKRGTYGVRPSLVIQFSPSRNVLATAGPDHTARLWEAASGRELMRLAHDSIVTVVEFGPRGNVLATATEGGVVHLWDTESGEEIGRMNHGDAVYELDVSKPGNYLASASVNRTTRVWKLESGKEVRRITHDKAVETVVFSPDETLIATATSGSLEKTTIWETQTGNEVWRLPIGQASHQELVFGPNGRILVSGGYGGLTWWDLQAKELIHTISNSKGAKWAGDLALTQDGKYIAARLSDGTARVWDLESGREVKRIPYYMREMGIAVSPDGRFFASSGSDGRQMLIEITEIWPDDPAEAACRQLNRNMTKNEWRQYMGLKPYKPTCPK
ncbi:MAG: right-handed parallel beta-helix repeat-containing protein, partial [Planctomycetota bacterium]